MRKVPELPPPDGSGRSLMPTHKPTCPHALEKKTRSPGYHQVPFICCLRTTIDHQNLFHFLPPLLTG